MCNDITENSQLVARLYIVYNKDDDTVSFEYSTLTAELLVFITTRGAEQLYCSCIQEERPGRNSCRKYIVQE